LFYGHHFREPQCRQMNEQTFYTCCKIRSPVRIAVLRTNVFTTDKVNNTLFDQALYIIHTSHIFSKGLLHWVLWSLTFVNTVHNGWRVKSEMFQVQSDHKSNQRGRVKQDRWFLSTSPPHQTVRISRPVHTTRTRQPTTWHDVIMRQDVIDCCVYATWYEDISGSGAALCNVTVERFPRQWRRRQAWEQLFGQWCWCDQSVHLLRDRQILFFLQCFLDLKADAWCDSNKAGVFMSSVYDFFYALDNDFGFLRFWKILRFEVGVIWLLCIIICWTNNMFVFHFRCLDTLFLKF
jgi:hypothetical protein